MTEDPVFRPATESDASILAAKITEVSPDVVDILLKDLVPGISAESLLTMTLRDTSSHYSYKNCVLAEIGGKVAGLLFAYPAENQKIPVIMETTVPAQRLDPVREILTAGEPDSLYVNTLWVDPDTRGQGLADALIDYACFWAESLGLKYLSLFCWRDNSRAVSFYHRQGFKAVREITALGTLSKFHDRGDLYVRTLGDDD